MDCRGKIINQKRLVNDGSIIINHFRSIGWKHKTTLATSNSWYWLCVVLQETKTDIKLAHAKHLKAISFAKVKTDKIDSKPLAELLIVNLIPSAHMISKDKLGLRDLMRTRL